MNLFYYLSICVVFVNACEQQQSCRACIRHFKLCLWCASETITGPRCILESSMPLNWCPDEVQNPNSTKIIIPHEVDNTQTSQEIVQIKPKRIEMSLRPGHSVDFDFSYTAAEHYPVDLYFLFDASMEIKLWEKHVEQTENVIEWIQTVTNNASIGFGTFTNKNALPFTSIKNETLSYSFRHEFSLSRDTDGFRKALNTVNIVKSAFLDNANGGFDALAQVIVCKDIGWRNISRRIVVFLSDNSYYSAGDGMAAGIFDLYDGKCHTKNGIYTKELEMDYPSPFMINKLASEQKVTIIFVIDTVVKTLYDPLTKIINGAHVISPTVTKRHEETVASEIKKTYENITKVIKLNVNINPNYENKIDVKIDPDCNKLECVVEQNKEQKFSGKITVLEYFKAEEIKVTISVNGIRETLTLDIKLAECNCRAGDDGLCNGGGTRQCGICECHQNRSGINCECHSTNPDANKDKSTCMMPNSTIECSGRGSCICGICRCGEQRYRGRYCECDDELCPKDKNGRLCGHGQCHCGECNCEPGWTKTSQRTCICESSRDRCQTGDHECSNYGHCECNECQCPETICDWDARSSQGSRCNPLPCGDCHQRQCRLLESYALSRSDGNTPCGKRVYITSVKKLDNETSWALCSNIRSNVGCYTNFVYRYDDENYGVHLIVQSEHDCAESAYIYGGACLGGLIFIGIITLVGWKVLNTYRDRQEYKRFKRQHQESMKRAKQHMSPIFKGANTFFKNPLHENKDDTKELATQHDC